MESDGFFELLKNQGGRQNIKGGFQKFLGGKSLLGEGKSPFGCAPCPL